MSKTYDPQYSTQVSFNRPIMETMLNKRDIALVEHWFEHGEPNKNLAASALECLLHMEWIEALDLLWNLGWLTKKSIISKAWILITGGYGRFYNDKLAGTATEQWLVHKTYNEKVLSVNEINNLKLTILEKSSSQYYWDMFFTPDLKLKGKLSQAIFQNVKYFAYYDKSQGNKLERSLANIPQMKARLNAIVTHPNGFEIDYTQLLDVLITYSDVEMFWLMINNKIILNQKELFVLATLLSIYFNVIGKKLLKMTDTEIEKNVHEMVTCLVKLGLPEQVTFTEDDFLDEYRQLFSMGYIALSNLNFFSGYCFSTAAYQLDSAPTYYGDPKLGDMTFHTGEAVFSKQQKVRFDDVYVKPTPEEQVAFRNRFKLYLK